MRVERATIDFETRSEADIKKSGAWLYSKHPTTRISHLYFKFPGDAEVSGWIAPHWDDDTGMFYEATLVGPRPLQDLWDWVEQGGMVEAHNAAFEDFIWNNLAVNEYGYDEVGATGLGAPPLPLEQLMCSAAKCASYSLPRDLEGAGAALRLPIQKDADGKRLMLRMAKPQKVRSGPDKGSFYWVNSHDIFMRVGLYCGRDVDAEEAISEQVPDLTDFERNVWLADQRANRRGVLIDRELVDSVIKVDADIKRILNGELHRITGVERASMRAQLLSWFGERGHDLPDSAADTLDWLIKSEEFKHWPEEEKKALQLMRVANRTSVRKFNRILECLDPDDGRVRELVMYHGANTGRWTGKGIQVQNFPRGNLGGSEPPWNIDIEEAVEEVKASSADWLLAYYDDAMELLSSVARGAIVASPGKRLAVADYAAIEARCVLWEADAFDALDIFRRGEDIYCAMATDLYGRPITKADANERQFGKAAVLGLGYGMGYITFLLTIRKKPYYIEISHEQARLICGPKYDLYMRWVRNRLFPVKEEFADPKKYRAAAQQAALDRRKLLDARIDPESVLHELAACKYVVDRYRKRFPEVPAMWAAQEEAAIQAVLEWQDREPDDFSPDGPAIPCGKVTWQVRGRWLHCILPSGRSIIYADPEIKWTRTPWGERRPELRYWGVHKKTKKWARMSTYGGSLVENITQAIARDMMAHALVTCDQSSGGNGREYAPLMTVHDELVNETDESVEDADELEEIMIDLPAIYDGCPVKAEGWIGPRYKK